MLEYRFLWFIEKCSYLWHQPGESLRSPKFIAEGLEGTEWCLVLYPRGFKNQDKLHTSLGILRNQTDAGPKTFLLKFELSLLTPDGSVFCSRKREDSFDNGNEKGYSFIKFGDIHLNRIAKQLSAGTLIMCCSIWKEEGNIYNIVQTIATTRIGIEKISFLQSVKSFSALGENCKSYSQFRSHSKSEAVISSSLFSCEGKLVMEIFSSIANHILSKCKIFILGASGSMDKCGEADNRFGATRKDIRKIPLTFTRQAILDKKRKFLLADNLSFLCECAFTTGLEFERIEENLHEMPIEIMKRISDHAPSNYSGNIVEESTTYTNISQDMKEIFINQGFTNVELKTNIKAFAAHKVLLCARSPVFKTMMNTNGLRFNDMEDDIVKELLLFLFLYSGNSGELQWEIAYQLYQAADKYQIGKLKAQCTSFLIEKLSINTAGEVLLLASNHNDSAFKKAAEDFILKHEKQIFGSKEWKDLSQSNPYLVAKTMILKYRRWDADD